MAGEWMRAARGVLEYLIVRLQYRKEEQLDEFIALRGTLVVSVAIEELVLPVNQTRCTTVIAAKGNFCHELSDQTQREMERLLPLCQSKTLTRGWCPHESLHAMPFQVSFELQEKSGVLQEDCLAMKQFIHRLSLVHTTITFHYCVNAKGSISAKTYSREKRNSICLPDGRKLLNDGSYFVRKADWSCDKLHPVAGDQVNLFIPEQVAERGFSGQLRLMPVVSLCPCQKSFPNQPTRITTASIFVYDPAGLPILFPTNEASCPFFEDSSHLALWERYGYQATLSSDPYWEEGTAKPDVRFRLHTSHKHNPDAQEQTLLLFLFLGYSDPFQDQPGYTFFMVSPAAANDEAERVSWNPGGAAGNHQVILAHLYPILLCSEQAVKGAIHAVVNRILEQQCREAQEQEKLAHSLPIMVDAISSIVSSSTNCEFRGRCLQSLQVADTQELQLTIKEIISKVTLKRWRASSVCDIRKPLPKKDEAGQPSSGCPLSPLGQKPACSSIHSEDLGQGEKDTCSGEGLLPNRPDCGRMSQPKKRPAVEGPSVEDCRDPDVSGDGGRKRSGLLADQDVSRSSSFSCPSQIRPAAFLDTAGGSSEENSAEAMEDLWPDDDFWNQEVSNLSQWTS